MYDTDLARQSNPALHHPQQLLMREEKQHGEATHGELQRQLPHRQETQSAVEGTTASEGENSPLPDVARQELAPQV